MLSPAHIASERGHSLVEFSLVAPIALLLLMAIVIVAIAITNLVQLTNAARDGVRVAAICGSVSGTEMPDGSGACSNTAVAGYITAHLTAIPAGSVAPQIYVCTPAEAAAGTCTTSGTSGIENCQPGRIVEVDMYYDQPLYLPLISQIFATSGNGSWRLNASAQATCEQ